MSATSWRMPLLIGTDHPCLPGHFPGQPIVPGVLLLEQVALALRDWRQCRVTRIVEAKFMAPLLPGQLAEILLREAGSGIRFEIRRDELPLARGLLETAPPA